MLIVSKFHDYYDSAIAYGVDKECVYNRKTEEINKSKSKFDHAVIYSNKDYEFRLSKHIIGFCGVMYRCIRIVEKKKWPIEEYTEVFYDANSLIEYMTMHKIGLSEPKSYSWNRWNHNGIYKSEAGIREFYNKKIEQEYYDIFTDQHVPVFLEDAGKLFINPCLKDYKFGKIKDAVTAFQEIHMYLAGVLGQPKEEITDPPDKAKVKIHGFNKWSFRTMPGDGKKGKK